VNKELAIIILAAGPSSRMRQSKQQLLIDDKSLLIKAVETALQSNVKNVVVVLGSQEESHKEALKGLAIETIFNSRWKTGMGSSLKAGLNYIISNIPKTDAVIVMVCDQPLLKPQHLKLIIERYRETNALIVASGYSNTSGVPALFNHQLFDEVLKLGDDQGAKKIIHQHPAEVIDFPEGAIDLDTPEDYQRFIQQHSKKMS